MLSIIIINYKTPQLTIRCLDSIYSNFTDNAEIIVIDNYSDDNSLEIIHSKYPDVKLIQNDVNEGFGRANNKGIKESSGEYILLLNSDMVIPTGTIEACIHRISQDKKIGVLGCKLVNEDGSFQKSTYSIASIRKLLDSNLLINYIFPLKKEKIEAVMGSFMLIPRFVFNEIGLFDPDFFMYSEELELCNRINKAGYKVCYYDAVYAIHKHEGSSENKDWNNKQRFLSNALLFYKVKGFLGYCMYNFVFILNCFCNFFLMWFLDSKYRKSYFKTQKYYFSNVVYYFLIPFLFTKQMGDGKRLLRRS